MTFPEPNSPLGFVIRFGSIGSELGRLLGANFVPGAELNNTPMGLAQQRILPLFNAGRRDEAEWELARLGLLVKALSIIESADPVLLGRLTKRLLSRNVDLYYGTWQEVAIGASVLARGDKLVHEPPGGPDFEAEGPSGDIVGIECSSVHVPASLNAHDLFVIEPTVPGVRDLSHKLLRKIRDKAKKPYAGPNVLLTIDATNIFALSGSEQPSLTKAEKALEKSGFGALLVTGMLVNLDKEPAVVEMGILRREASSITPELRSFLNRHWPLREKFVERHATPLIP